MFSSLHLFGIALLALLPSIASSQVLCFASASSSKPIRLQITLPREGSLTAFVRYERGTADIPAMRVSEVVVSPSIQTPAAVKTSYAEWIDGRQTGQYVLTTQGGAIGDLTYSRQTDKKAIVFYEDHEASGSEACNWHQKRAGVPTPTNHQECRDNIESRRNADGSSVRVIERQCDGQQMRKIEVLLKPRNASTYMTVLARAQDVQEAPTGGGRLRDIEGDGIFEYEEIGGCGAGPNCEATVFKLNKERKGFYLFFESGYSDFKYFPGMYVESGRASCCSWEHHVYQAPDSERSISERDFLYSITVGGLSDEKNALTPCLISIKKGDKWIPHTPTDKHLLALCETYGTDYVVNPPTREADDE